MFSTAINSHLSGLNKLDVVEFHTASPSASPARRLSSSFTHATPISDAPGHSPMIFLNGGNARKHRDEVTGTVAVIHADERIHADEMIAALSSPRQHLETPPPSPPPTSALKDTVDIPRKPQRSPAFKDLIAPSLFNNIQKGFDEYEGTRRQQEDVVDAIENQNDNEDVTVRARQAFVANSYEVNERIRKEMNRMANEKGKMHWSRMPSGLSPDQHRNSVLTSGMSVQSIRRSLRLQLAKESDELTSSIHEWCEDTAFGLDVDMEPEISSWDILNSKNNDLNDLEKKLLKLLLRKKRSLKGASKKLVKTGRLSKKGSKTILRSTTETNKNGFLKGDHFHGASLPFTGDSSLNDQTRRKKKKKKTSLLSNILSKHNVSKVPKRRSDRLQLALTMMSSPTKMSKATRRRLYAKSEVNKRSKEALRRRTAIHKATPFRRTVCFDHMSTFPV